MGHMFFFAFVGCLGVAKIDIIGWMGEKVTMNMTFVL
jgi:hypothetical protein